MIVVVVMDKMGGLPSCSGCGRGGSGGGSDG